MKITLPENYKEILTLKELEAAKDIIKDFKSGVNSCLTLDEAARIAVHAVTRGCAFSDCEILKATAEICKNNKVMYNYYLDNSGRLDIWVEFIAFSRFTGFIQMGCYLSDIYSVGDFETKQDLLHNSNIYFYPEIESRFENNRADVIGVEA